MTLLEIERVVRKITEILQNGGTSDIAAKVAGDFAAICHTTNLRLQQCEAMLKAGDRHQAIQLAETSPNLLDLVTILEFRGADDWRSYCQQNALPVAGRIDGRAVQELNQCYAQGIPTDHPLYAAYRRAALGRNDEEALKALQSITRLNPHDSNGADELARLTAKVLARKLEHLDRLISNGDAALVIGAIDAIEAFGFKAGLDGDVWRKAGVIRCVDLLESATKQKAAAQWVEVLAKVDFIKRLQKEFSLDLPDVSLKWLAEFDAWGRGEFEKDRLDKEFKGLLTRLRHRIQQSEEKDTSARYVELPELKQDSEGLHKVWRALTDFTRPIPEDLAAAFRKRSGLIDAEIARRMAVRLRIMLASTAAVVVVAGVIIWLAVGRMKAGDFERQLRTAVANQQVHAATQLIDRLKTGEKGLLNGQGVNAALAAAETFVAEQTALLGNFNAALARLPTKLGGDPDAAQINGIADQLARVRTALAALASDLKQENEPRLNAFEQQWQQYLSESGNLVNGILEQWVADAETLGGQLDYRAPLATATAQLAKLSDDLRKIHDCEAGFKGQMTLRNDLLQRAGIVQNKFTAYDHELKKIDAGLTAMKKAAQYQEYALAVSNVAASEYSSAPAVAAALAVQNLGLDEESVLRTLLNVTNPATWAFINHQASLDFVPEMAMPAEQHAFQKLFADPSINAVHQHYRLYLDPNRTVSVDWITAGRLDTAEGWMKIPAWTVSPLAASAFFEDHDYGNFSGRMKLSPTQLVYHIENIIEPDGTAAFDKVGLNEIVKADATYGGSLLAVLDTLNNSRDGSPVFRAQLFCALAQIMEYQPDAWGLSFCPGIRKQVARINQITGGPISSGDWLIATKTSDWGPKLEQVFATKDVISYANQAKACLALEQAVSRDGLKYIGFAGLDGKPVLARETAPAEMWCYTPKGLARFTGSAIPLSPLFALASRRSEYLSRTGVNANDPLLKTILPPMFRD